jgi:hypothetical protein
LSSSAYGPATGPNGSHQEAAGSSWSRSCQKACARSKRDSPRLGSRLLHPCHLLHTFVHRDRVSQIVAREMRFAVSGLGHHRRFVGRGFPSIRGRVDPGSTASRKTSTAGASARAGARRMSRSVRKVGIPVGHAIARAGSRLVCIRVMQRWVARAGGIQNRTIWIHASVRNDCPSRAEWTI